MANNIHTLIEFKNRKSFEKFCSLYLTEHEINGDFFKYFDLNKVTPQPKCEADCPEYFVNNVLYKFKGTSSVKSCNPYPEMDGFDWYHWRCDKWGTKWNTMETFIDDDKCDIYFDTAWSCPYMTFEVIASTEPEMFSDMSIYSICELNGSSKGWSVRLRDNTDLTPADGYKCIIVDEYDLSSPNLTFEYLDEKYPWFTKIFKHYDEYDEIELKHSDEQVPEKKNNWKVGESSTVLNTFIWDVMETEKTTSDGKTCKFVSLKAPDWVKAVIKNTDTDRFVLCQEFRHGVNEYVIEFPSGTVEPGEDPMDAVKREVTEETGFKNINKCVLIDTRNPNAAFMSNKMYIYYIEVSGNKSNRNLDEFEDLDVFEVNNPESYLNGGLIDQYAWLITKNFLKNVDS